MASTLEVFQKVRGVCVDGQLLKTAQVMQQSAFPNIIIVIIIIIMLIIMIMMIVLSMMIIMRIL